MTSQPEQTPDPVSAVQVAGKVRTCQLTTYELHRLDQACKPIFQAFGSHPYLVGSSSIGGSSDYRDVDVRLILGDDEFDALFADGIELWAMVCLAMSAWLIQQTGLRIDFQIQRQTEANENHDGPRNPLGTGRLFAGGGDATRFTVREADADTTQSRP